MASLTRLLWKCRSIYTLNAFLMMAICLTIFLTYGMNKNVNVARNRVVSSVQQEQRVSLVEHSKQKRDINSYFEEDDSVEGMNSEESSSFEDSPLNSLNPDATKRVEFQKKRVADFCAKYPDMKEAPKKEWLRKDLFKHLLYNDDKKVVFCYVPKVGCSNWKRMFLVLEGRLPVPMEGEKRPSESFLNGAAKLRDLPENEREWRLKKYRRFTMMRDPLERVVSGYNNKINHPISLNRTIFPENVKYDIQRRYSPQTILSFQQSGGKEEIVPTFDNYVRYLTETEPQMLNEHFKSFMELCHPCYVDYEIYGNFKLLPEEAYTMMDYFSIPREDYPMAVSHPGLSTSDLLPLYYSEMTPQQKVVYARELAASHGASMPQFPHQALSQERYGQIFSTFARDLELYYALYPEDKRKHSEYRDSDL